MAQELDYKSIRRSIIDRKATRVPIQKRWDFARNDVMRPPYFPYQFKETPEHYRDRLKIGVPWCGSLAGKIASYFRKEPITTHFLVGGKSEGPLVDEADELWAATAALNTWLPFMTDVARDAGVGGNGYTKERFALYDAETGEQLKTGSLNGRVFIDRVNEVYVYRIPIDGVVSYVVAWMSVNGAIGLLEEYAGEGEKIEHIELIVPARHDEMTGKQLTQARWQIWRNGIIVYGPHELPYGLTIQRFANLVSRPESEDGISDIEQAIPLNHMISHVFTGAARAVQYHGEPKTVATGVEDIADVKWSTDNFVLMPIGADGKPSTLGFLTWDQNIGAAQSLYKDAADIMMAIAGVPKHMMHDLEGAGQVPSGVALRIVYEALNQLCVLKEAGFKRAEERAIKTSLQQLAYYNNQGARFKDLQVEVLYNPNRTPVDAAAEFQADVQKLMQNYLNLVDLVIKHEAGIDTREQAMEWLRERAVEKKELKAMGLVANTFQWSEEGAGDAGAGD